MFCLQRRRTDHYTDEMKVFHLGGKLIKRFIKIDYDEGIFSWLVDQIYIDIYECLFRGLPDLFLFDSGGFLTPTKNIKFM